MAVGARPKALASSDSLRFPHSPKPKRQPALTRRLDNGRARRSDECRVDHDESPWRLDGWKERRQAKVKQTVGTLVGRVNMLQGTLRSRPLNLCQPLAAPLLPQRFTCTRASPSASMRHLQLAICLMSRTFVNRCQKHAPSIAASVSFNSFQGCHRLLVHSRDASRRQRYCLPRSSTHAQPPITLHLQLRASSRTRNLTLPGVLIECDPSIKSIIVNIDDAENHQYIIQDLDEERVVVMENLVASLKAKLEKVCPSFSSRSPLLEKQADD